MRDELARQQAELVAALVDGGPPPPGVDGDRLRVAAAALLEKRGRAIERTWPRLAMALATAWPEELGRHLHERPGPPPSGALGDGRSLARVLAREGRLPWEGRLELLGVDLRYRWTRDGRRLPRGSGLRLAWSWRPFRLVVAARAPGLGERWLRLL